MTTPLFLVSELLEEGYSYVLRSRIQNDPIERNFSTLRQISGFRFPVSLREVKTSEQIILLSNIIRKKSKRLGRDSISYSFTNSN